MKSVVLAFKTPKMRYGFLYNIVELMCMLNYFLKRKDYYRHVRRKLLKKNCDNVLMELLFTSKGELQHSLAPGVIQEA